MKNDYYVYFHRNPITNEVFYVGRGSGKRAWSKSYRNSSWKEVAQNGFSVEIVENNLSLIDANKLEEILISKYKDTIINRTKKFSIIPIVYSDVSKYFIYDENSPSFLSRISPKELNSGATVGIVGPSGHILKASNPLKNYWKVKHNNRSLSVHRVIWVLFNKEDLDSDLVIDHIDGNGLNNNIVNLRLCTQKENSRNRQFQNGSANNPSGVYGVHWEKPNYNCKLGRWNAIYTLDGKQKSKTFNPIKLFPNLPFEEAKQKAFEDAVAYRKQMEELYYK